VAQAFVVVMLNVTHQGPSTQSDLIIFISEFLSNVMWFCSFIVMYVVRMANHTSICFEVGDFELWSSLCYPLPSRSGNFKHSYSLSYEARS
jgi:hypothetical protein